MTTILLKLNNMQEKELKKFMKEEGYTNKTEFFRFLIKFYKYNKSPLELRYDRAVEALKKAVGELKKKGKLNKSLEEQLNDI